MVLSTILIIDVYLSLLLGLSLAMALTFVLLHTLTCSTLRRGRSMTLVLLLWLATAIASIFVLLPGLAPAYLCLFLLGFTPAAPL